MPIRSWWKAYFNLEQRSYDYRMLAYDEAENVSNSQQVSALPLTSRIVGVVENFRKESLDETSPSGVQLLEAFDAINRVIAELENNGDVPKATIMVDLQTLLVFSVITQDEMDGIINRESGAIAIEFLDLRSEEFWAQFTLLTLTLVWDYETMDGLASVKVYRSKDGGELIDYDEIAITDITNFMYVDTDIKVNSDYLYQITMVHEGGQTSAKSEVLYVRVP